jgi:SAM-dependent methyltransferase
VPYEETQAGYERENPEWDVNTFDELPHRFRQAPQGIFNGIKRYRTEPCSVLDIGCYRGFLLKYFQSHGWTDVFGIEPSKSASAFARARLGLDVFNGYLEDYLADESWRRFDVVVVAQVIEHTPNPADFIEAVKQVMTTDAILVLELPYFSGPNVWGKATASRLQLGKSAWNFLSFPKHIYNFTPRAMKILLQQRGFEVLEWSVRSKIREKDGSFMKKVRHIKGKLRWGSTMQFIAQVGESASSGS